MTHWTPIWHRRGGRFDVELSWTPEDYPDLSWDETGEAAAKIDSGEWGNFCFRVAVYFGGNIIADTHLGNSIYADPEEFAREHIGIKARSRTDNCNYGCYHSSMVREAISDARKYLAAMQHIHIRSNANV